VPPLGDRGSSEADKAKIAELERVIGHNLDYPHSALMGMSPLDFEASLNQTQTAVVWKKTQPTFKTICLDFWGALHQPPNRMVAKRCTIQITS
jgi:hypothetical protein